MRLNRLDITRYGMFTDYSVDFGERRNSEPDLHIVYGSNEAGKSTAFAAFLDLLFGIEARSRFNFLHPYPTMRIGASLELVNGSQELLRVKRPQNSLFDGKEQPISEGIILGELGGIDRDSYRTMFSLDDETLEAGGESVLASKGDLGQLLFSATAGLADLSQSLVKIRDEADGFYKFHARGGKLSDLKARLAALKEERERIDTLASQYARLIDVRDREFLKYEEAIAKRGQIQSRMDEIQRLLSALPRLTTLREIRESLVPLANLPDAPFGWADELPKLAQDEVELDTRLQGLEEEINRLSGELTAIEVDEIALMLSERVERLSDLRARYMTADKDLPERRLELRRAELEISGILSRIERDGETEPRRLLLGASIVGGLRDLIEARSGIQAAVNSGQAELLEARRRLDDAEAKLRDAGVRPEEGAGRDARILLLAATVAALRTDDHATRHRLATRSRATRHETLAQRLLELRPWEGDVEQLAEMIVPTAGDIERWKTAAAATQREIDRHGGDVERLTTERIRLKAELDAIGSVAGVVNDQEASTVRRAREQAWASHRHTLDADSADVFEAVLRQDDVVSSSRLGHTADLAKLHQRSQTLAVVEADLIRAQELRTASMEVVQRLHKEIAIALRLMTQYLSEKLTLPQLEDWLTRRAKTLEVRESVLDAERALKEAEADGSTARDRLTTALVAAGITHEPTANFETLLATVQVAIDQEAELRALFKAVGDCQRDLKKREREAEKADSAEAGWTASWSNACAACWLGEDGSTPQLATVREVIADIANLAPALEKRASLADRISKMENDQVSFTEEAAAVEQALNVIPTSAAILDRAHVIFSCVQDAREAESRQATKAQSIENAINKRREITATIAIHGTRKIEMTRFFDVESLTHVASKLREIEKRSELQKQENAATRDILDALRLPTMEDAEHAIDLADRAALEMECAELKGRFEDQDQRSREMFSAHSKAVDQVEAVGGDNVVASIEEQRQTIRLEIEDKALQYLRWRVGTAAADQALRAYRDHHRSSMMARASSAFQTISRGAYTGLATQPEKESEILIAVGAAGGSKLASELSKGTRFQLYLALRVAGYHEFARTRRPVPFIADDIMETFDDFRAEETFRLFAEMAMVGQVIYFTHHKHLCEIAHRSCPGARVHSLGSDRP